MKESFVLHRKITPDSLAKMNLSRQKAKSTLTILSLSLGGVLVVLISTMLASYDGVAEARGRAFPVGEFNIQLNANQSWDTAGISLSCFKSVPISMILKLRWVIPSKWTIKPNPGKFTQRPIQSWAL